MTIESAISFYEESAGNPEIQAQIKELEPLGVQAVANYINELGYEFTLDEIKKVISDNTMKLTDDTLEKVSGGCVLSPRY